MHKCFWLLFVLLATPAFASPEDELQQVNEQLRATSQQTEALQKRSSKLEKELAELQEQLVALAAKLQANERKITKGEFELEEITKRQIITEKSFENRQASLAESLNAMVRFSRVPPEAWVAMPGDIHQSLQAATALKHLTAALEDQATALQADIKALEALREQAEVTRKKLEVEGGQLAKSQALVKEKITQRQGVQHKIGNDMQEQQQALAELTERASSLQDLISSLEQRRAKESKQAKGQKKLRFAGGKNSMTRPAEGDIETAFGEGEGVYAKGVEISTRDGAQVVAPQDAEVVYAGNFLRYGTIVLLRHSDNIHTLLAGIKSLDSRTGERVLKGEPVGRMGRTKEGLTKLYVELRKNAKPIDPLPWMAE